MDDRDPAAARTDADCAARAVGGDAEAFRALVLRHQGPLFTVLRELHLAEADREDVAQDAFIAAWTHLATWDAARGSFFTWLVAIARNRAINVRKRRRPEPVADLPDRSGGPRVDAALEREDTARRLDAALAALPEDQRTAFVLVEVHGLALADVATVTGVPVGTVKSRAARARERLRRALAETEVRT